jgi:transcriptional regulator with XRE-family HTH domain
MIAGEDRFGTIPSVDEQQRRRAGALQMEGRARAQYLAKRIGAGLRESRLGSRLTQEDASHRAGISQTSWSRIERGATIAVSLETLASCAAAVGTQLASFIEARPGSDLPRDIEHLRRQDLVIATARAGGWSARPELGIDSDSGRSRSIDVYLSRFAEREIAVVEIVDLFADAGADLRGLTDKVAAVRRASPPGSRVRGLLVLRATNRNRTTVAELASLFAARFPAQSRAWLDALRSPTSAMPEDDGLLWSSVSGDQLKVVRLPRPAGATDRRPSQ